MAKLKVKANKLENATVTFISLVNRGANRIPFRIVKLDKEQEMGLDLNTIWKRGIMKSEQKSVQKDEPKLVGLVIEKTEAEAAFVEVLKEHGFNVEDRMEVGDGTVVFKQEGFEEGNAKVFKVSNRLLALVAKTEGVVIPDVAEEFAGANDFYPALEDVHVVSKAEGDFSALLAYTGIVQKLIPQAVFKAAVALDKIEVPVAKSADADMDDEEEKKRKEKEMEMASAKKDEAGAEVKKEDEAPAKTSDEDSGKAVITAEQVTELVQKNVAEGLKAIMDKLGEISEIQKSFKELSATVSGIHEQGVSLAQKMTEVEQVAKAAERSVKQTIVGAAPTGDPEPQRAVRKQEDTDPRSGTFDTAFLPRRNPAKHSR
jgi:hypothetical protein